MEEHDVRLAIIGAVLRATKSDIEKLRGEFRGGMARLEQRIDVLEGRVEELEERMARLEGRVDMLFKFTLAFNTLILVAVIGILLRMVLAP